MEETVMIPSKKVELGGFRYLFELKGVPAQFANAIRRILLNETPVVEIGDVQILENSTLMPHEMLKLRTELLPVNVRPTEQDVIRGARLALRIDSTGDTRFVTTDDFTVTGARADILLKDRDLGTPIYFLKVKAGESVNLTAALRVNELASHVCVSTYFNHIDEDLTAADKEAFLEENEGWEDAEKVFDNFYRQRSFYKNEKGRPDWFDFTVESIGIVPARELVRDALTLLKARTIRWTKAEVVRESEEGVYTVLVDNEGHTVGGLVQAMLYDSDLCSFAAYDVPHPLRSDMRVRFRTDKTVEEIMAFVVAKVTEYCDTCLGLL